MHPPARARPILRAAWTAVAIFSLSAVARAAGEQPYVADTFHARGDTPGYSGHLSGDGALSANGDYVVGYGD